MEVLPILSLIIMFFWFSHQMCFNDTGRLILDLFHYVSVQLNLKLIPNPADFYMGLWNMHIYLIELTFSVGSSHKHFYSPLDFILSHK